MWLLMKDAWRTKSWKEKFTLWFKPTGYRPADVAKKYPVFKIDDVYHFNKYAPKASTVLQAWSWAQIVFVLLSISYLFGNIATINKINGSFIYLYGVFVFLSVYALTELMDRNPYSLFWETLKNTLALAIIFYYGDWFGASQYLSWINYFLVAYFIITTIVCGWFVYTHLKEDRQISNAISV